MALEIGCAVLRHLRLTDVTEMDKNCSSGNSGKTENKRISLM